MDLKPKKEGLPAIVSLFCGAGGLDLGFKDAGFEIPLAFDSSCAAILSHTKNFPETHARLADLTLLRPNGVLECVRKRLTDGQRIGVIGGPPCQGFSRANVGAKSDDPRNQLPALYLDIVKALQTAFSVDFMVFENVLGIRDKKHAETYAALVKGISSLGFDVNAQELCAVDFGVPQKRKRIILSATRAGEGFGKVVPQKQEGVKTVRHAISEIPEPKFYSPNLLPSDLPVHPNHWTMRPKSYRFKDPGFQEKTGRSFRRLKWDAPSPTIAFGNREIHVHPCGHRRLSIYEAMLLQGFPKTFVLEGNLSEQVTQVSNAVPPPLALSLALAVISALDRR